MMKPIGQKEFNTQAWAVLEIVLLIKTFHLIYDKVHTLYPDYNPLQKQINSTCLHFIWD